MRHAHAADDASALRETLEHALSASDLLITTGGASVGERDFVKPLLRELGCAFEFDSVALRPAKPTAFATRGDVRVAVLPGNPSSAFVALHEIVRIAALGMAGCAGDNRLPRVPATLAGDRIHGKAERTYAAYATVRTSRRRGSSRPRSTTNVPRSRARPPTPTASSSSRRAVTTTRPGDAVDVDVVDWASVPKAG